MNSRQEKSNYPFVFLNQSIRARVDEHQDALQPAEQSAIIDESWIHELDIVLGSSPKDPAKAIDRAFDRAFHLANTTSYDSSLKYLVRTADRLTSSEELAFEDVEHSLIRSMVSYPHCIDYCVLLFLKQHALGNANEKLWEEVIIPRSLTLTSSLNSILRKAVVP
jgi:hypothetical protein